MVVVPGLTVENSGVAGVIIVVSVVVIPGTAVGGPSGSLSVCRPTECNKSAAKVEVAGSSKVPEEAAYILLFVSDVVIPPCPPIRTAATTASGPRSGLSP